MLKTFYILISLSSEFEGAKGELRIFNFMRKMKSMLTILGYESKLYGGKNRIMLICLCECGNKKIMSKDSYNKNISCGCFLKNRILKNKNQGIINRRSSTEYKSYIHMKSRCLNINDPKYKSYGGRGIRICQEWINDFDNFIRDMGLKPEGMNSIDRIDNNGNYEPDNCRWSFPKQQSNNTRRNVFIEYQGISMTISQWASKIKCTPDYIQTRLRYRGWSFERIFLTVKARNIV